MPIFFFFGVGVGGGDVGGGGERANSEKRDTTNYVCSSISTTGLPQGLNVVRPLHRRRWCSVLTGMSVVQCSDPYVDGALF